LIELYLQRSEAAIQKTDAQYGSYCRAIISCILPRKEDVEECINDVHLKVWNAIPPTRPKNFKVWLGVIARNTALARLRREPKLRVAPLSELEYCLPADQDLQDAVNVEQLAEAINTFLRTQPQKQQIAFVRRYWYRNTITEVADHMGWTVGKTKSTLFRMRNRLADALRKEGFLE